VADALASIYAYIVVVLGYDGGALTYDPAFPDLSTLKDLEPCFGYWIKTTDAVDLIYPDIVASFVHEPKDHTYTKESVVPRVAISNSWINLYSTGAKLDGKTLASGSLIEAFNVGGVLIGEAVVRDGGQFGFMPIYGAETFSGDVVAGKSVGDKITLKVNGVPVEETVNFTSNGDRIELNDLTSLGKGGVLPTAFTLEQNYPNPFNPETTIKYVVANAGMVEVSIYNVLGNKVKTLVSGYQAAGSYTTKWHGDNESGDLVSSGVYFYKMTAGEFTDIKKMTLLK
jgi:hypothetical protein